MLLHIYSKNLFNKILFVDEKIFTIEQKFNRQNNKVYLDIIRGQSKSSTIRRGYHPSSEMVWWMSWNGATVIYFCMPGVKKTAEIYEKTILEPVVKSLNDTLFKWQRWIIQQDSTLAHKSKHCQKWLTNNISAFILADWISGNPNLNPLD